MMIPWKTLSRRTILDHNKFLSVEAHEVQLPDGRIIPDWPWVVCPKFVNVIPITVEGHFLMFRQVKYAVDGVSLAAIGGYLEPGEDPLNAAQRELREETGYEAEEWVHLGGFPIDANRGAGKGHFYLARQAKWVTKSHVDDLEEQELVKLTRSELEKALRGGEIKTLPWVASVALALAHLHATEV